MFALTTASVLAAITLASAAPATPAADPCATLAGVKWTSPAAVRACYTSIPLNETLRTNIIDTVSRVAAGHHTSTNVIIKAPQPFTADIHVDIVGELEKIRKRKYSNYYDFHVDVSDTLKLARDGHFWVTNYCFDSTFVTYNPFPLVVIKSPLGSIGSIHIAPEASKISAAEFPDQIDWWKSQPGLGDLASFDGATVLLINGLDPWIAVDKNAAVQGSYQGAAQRQNGFFSSYVASTTGWTYRVGDFAGRSLPVWDSVTLTVLKKGSILPTIVKVPYRSRVGAAVIPWTDRASFFAGNCLGGASYNGVDRYPDAAGGRTGPVELPTPTGRAAVLFPPLSKDDAKRPQNAVVDLDPLVNVDLPPALQPGAPVSGTGSMQFFLLPDNTTGVLALGSFSGLSFATLTNGLYDGLIDLKTRGATKLIVDITNNGGGYICIAHWLHRLIAGPSAATEPIAGLYTTVRGSPLAKKISARIAGGADPDNWLNYNPLGRRFENGTDIPEFYDWLNPGHPRTINGRADSFGDTIGDECQPFDRDAPAEPLFDPKDDVLVIGNGRCASSCSLFTIAMTEHYNTRTVVIGGKPNAKQQYCGTVGGQSTNYVTMDTEVKTVGLKNDPLAAPDLLAAVSMGITWRLGYSLKKPNVFEEWLDHPASAVYTPTAETVNKPLAIWQDIAKQYF